MPLNPYAACFQPLTAVASLSISGHEKYGKAVGLGVTVRTTTTFEEGSTHILDLPAEVLQRIVSCATLVPEDLAQIALTCKALMTALCSAGVHICITGFANALTASISASAITNSLHKYTPGVITLDLSGLPVDDKEVVDILRGLPKLQHLKLSSCRKLTPGLLSQLNNLASSYKVQHISNQVGNIDKHQGSAANSNLTGASNGTSKPEGSQVSNEASGTDLYHLPIKLSALDIQRCFQMTEECLDVLLHAAGVGHIPLKALAVSHLELDGWPAAFSHVEESRADFNGSTPSTTTIANTVDNEDSDDEVDANVLVSDMQLPVIESAFSATSITMLALNNCSGLQTASLTAVAAACPNLQYFMLGGSKLKMNHMDLPGAYTSKNRASVSREAAVLVRIIHQLPQLKVLDLSFFPLPTSAFVLEAADAKPNLQVLDFTSPQSVAAALSIWEATTSRRDKSHADSPSEPSCLTALQITLRCGVNCSNDARMSPLHVAAELGNAEMVKGLITMGANVNARKKSGAPPLLAAVYHGNLECARMLLDAGANPQLANTAGDGPLYTAALRGHLPVVRLLLEACVKQGIAWQDPHQYEDSWSPLMAAALADRYEVCSTLLEMAGPEASRIMVTAANRYGQGVLHIAARKGTPRLLRLLLKHASGAACMSADSYGDTPIDVARKNKNMPAMHELQRKANYHGHTM